MAEDEGPGVPQETWGPDDSDYEAELLAELELVLSKIMSYGHKTNIILTSYVFQARGVTAEHDRHPTTSGSMKNQDQVDSLGLVELLRGNLHKNLFGHRSD